MTDIDLSDLRAKAEAARDAEDESEWVGYYLGYSLTAEHDRPFIAAAKPSTIISLIDRIERLEKALKPFADEADQWDDFYDDEPLIEGFSDYDGVIAVRDLRNARAALNGPATDGTVGERRI